MPNCTFCDQPLEDHHHYCYRCGTYQNVKLPEDEEDYLMGFSWAPACPFYFFSRAMYVYLIYIFCLEWILSFFLRLAGSSAFYFITTTSFIASIVILIKAGINARRNRWIHIRWLTFQDFVENERIWNFWGIIFWIFYIISFILLMILLPKLDLIFS